MNNAVTSRISAPYSRCRSNPPISASPHARVPSQATSWPLRAECLYHSLPVATFERIEPLSEPSSPGLTRGSTPLLTAWMAGSSPAMTKRAAGRDEGGMTSKGGLTKEQLKAAVCEAIDRNGNRSIELGEPILHHPETGFNEQKTAALVADAMRTIGLEPQTGLALTGDKGRLKGKTSGPRLAFIGELDSLRTSDHPLADPHTGAAHSCGP